MENAQSSIHVTCHSNGFTLSSLSVSDKSKTRRVVDSRQAQAQPYQKDEDQYENNV